MVKMHQYLTGLAITRNLDIVLPKNKPGNTIDMTLDHCTAVAGNVNGIRLVECTTVDADTEVGLYGVFCGDPVNC